MRSARSPWRSQGFTRTPAPLKAVRASPAAVPVPAKQTAAQHRRDLRDRKLASAAAPAAACAAASSPGKPLYHQQPTAMHSTERTALSPLTAVHEALGKELPWTKVYTYASMLQVGGLQQRQQLHVTDTPATNMPHRISDDSSLTYSDHSRPARGREDVSPLLRLHAGQCAALPDAAGHPMFCNCGKKR